MTQIKRGVNFVPDYINNKYTAHDAGKVCPIDSVTLAWGEIDQDWVCTICGYKYGEAEKKKVRKELRSKAEASTNADEIMPILEKQKLARNADDDIYIHPVTRPRREEFVNRTSARQNWDPDDYRIAERYQMKGVSVIYPQDTGNVISGDKLVYDRDRRVEALKSQREIMRLTGTSYYPNPVNSDGTYDSNKSRKSGLKV